MTRTERSEIGGGNSGSSFFKVMVLDFEERLRIPPGFTKKFNGKLGGKFILKNQAGKCWDVKMENTNDGPFFGKGWGEFVKENSVQFGEIVSFQYDGCSELEVTIFGKNGCEKFGATATGFEKNMIAPKKEEYDEAEEREDHIKVAGGSPYRQRTCRVQTRPTRAKLPLQNKKPLELQLKLKHPHFTRILSRKDMIVIIPREFVRKYDLTSKEFLLFKGEEREKAWHLPAGYWQDGRGALQTPAWRRFQKSHGIRIGDTCVFELIRRNALRVHIIRAND